MEAFEQQGAHDAHRVLRRGGARLRVLLDDGQKRPVRAVQLIPLLGDGERHHPQGRRTEDFAQPCGGGGIREVRLESLGDGGEDFPRRRAVRIQRDVQREVVEVAVDAVDDVVIEGVRRDDARLRQPRFEKPLVERGDEPSEDVARAEVHPFGRRRRRRANRRDVKGRQPDARLPPVRRLPRNRFQPQFHCRVPFPCFLSDVRYFTIFALRSAAVWPGNRRGRLRVSEAARCARVRRGGREAAPRRDDGTRSR